MTLSPIDEEGTITLIGSVHSSNLVFALHLGRSGIVTAPVGLRSVPELVLNKGEDFKRPEHDK